MFYTIDNRKYRVEIKGERFQVRSKFDLEPTLSIISGVYLGTGHIFFCFVFS